MSISGISSTTNSLTDGLENWAAMMKKVQSEFKQLGSDLQSGNVTQAESDYTTLSQYLSDFSSRTTSTTASADSTTSTSSGSSSLDSAFTALGQDLQSGDLSAAQSDYTTLQNDLQQTTSQAPPPPPPPPPSSTSTSSSTDSILKELSALGDALSSGDLTTAQSAYTTIEQDLTQLGLTGLSSQTASSNVSVSG